MPMPMIEEVRSEIDRDFARLKEVHEAIREAAPFLAENEIRPLAYELRDGGEVGFMIDGISPGHIGVTQVEDALRAVASLAEQKGLCVFVLIDQPDDEDIFDADRKAEENGRVVEWLNGIGFQSLGFSLFAFGEMIGVDHRHVPGTTPSL